MIVIRPYTPDDKPTLVALLQLNIPTYFAPEEKTDFENYLDKKIDLYYVVEFNNEIIGCGGINLAENGTVGKISWDVFHPQFQGKGFGGQLLQYRINVLRKKPQIHKITVRTSQVAYRFYEKMGFETTEIINDYWVKGFDLYSMEYAPL